MCAEPQKTVKTFLEERTYRVDLYIYITRFRHHSVSPTGNHWPEFARLLVEVDGHDFHERTKQQASYDRRRDRELTLEGFRVIRFTGSEVYNHPYECAEDIDFQINDLASSVFKEFVERGKLEELIIG